MNKIREGFQMLGSSMAQGAPDEYFSPMPLSAIKLQMLTKELLTEEKQAGFKLSTGSAKHFQGFTLDPTETALLIGRQEYRKCMLKTITERFSSQLPPPLLEKLFLQTVAIVYCEKTFGKIKGSTETFARDYFHKHPESRIITKAIHVYCRTFIANFIYRLLKDLNPQREPEFYTALKNCYNGLKSKDRCAIEGLVWKYRSEETDDPEYGKHYVEKLFQEPGANFTPLIKALEEYLQITAKPNMSRTCDESMTPAFFKIKDPQGKTRGYLFPTCHVLPKDCSFFPRKVQRAFFKSHVMVEEYFKESDCALIITQHVHRDKMKFNNHPICFIDSKLLHQAMKWGKPILSLGTEESEQAQTGAFKNQSQNWEEQLTKPFIDSKSGEEAYRRLHESGTRWKSGQFLSSLAETGMDEANIKLCIQRNGIFSHSIDNYLRKFPHRFFFIMGAGHINDDGGSKGVISLLKDKDWTIIRSLYS